MWYACFLWAGLVLALLWLFYRKSMGFVGYRRAVLFIASPWTRSRGGARFIACSGIMRRKMRFEKDKVQFSLRAALTAGYMTVELMDGCKNRVFSIDPDAPEAAFTAKSGERYTLILRFERATGRFDLEWQ